MFLIINQTNQADTPIYCASLLKKTIHITQLACHKMITCYKRVVMYYARCIRSVYGEIALFIYYIISYFEYVFIFARFILILVILCHLYYFFNICYDFYL